MPNLSDQELAESYGLTYSFLQSSPELKKLFQDAVKNTWSADMFQAKFKNSSWYKNMSDSQRKAAILQYSDPAEWGALWNRTQHHVMDLLGQQGGKQDWGTINALSGNIISQGWNDERVQQEIGHYLNFPKDGAPGGKAGEDWDELTKYMYSMGVKNSDQWLRDAVTQTTSGRSSLQDYKNQIQQQATAAFPAYADQFKSGSTLADLAQPYMQSMATILEINPGTVNLFDNTIRNALNFKGTDGKVGSKPLWQFQNELKADPRWKQTQNAQDSLMGMGHKVLQDMGIYY